MMPPFLRKGKKTFEIFLSGRFYAPTAIARVCEQYPGIVAGIRTLGRDAVLELKPGQETRAEEVVNAVFELARQARGRS